MLRLPLLGTPLPLIPRLRHTSAVAAPASCSRRIAMTCTSMIVIASSSVPLPGGRTLLKSGGVCGAQVTQLTAP